MDSETEEAIGFFRFHGYRSLHCFPGGMNIHFTPKGGSILYTTKDYSRVYLTIEEGETQKTIKIEGLLASSFEKAYRTLIETKEGREFLGL